ncbi:ABC transporter ATP-binding protein [Myceligenerans xiligouense]|uniref:Peptide/nickel transport system ATP-binding protein/oligopeptide transport system ATP-binding protein n=1 Tax=Myceligenerans xiligouense TaxID=253184 RepID=A0A3N4Z464_9MICO|nr:dipeptide ABC transporter ATP-binding protein [Myceligenerans xiligouense]RPF19972.1 peptide/nickel transport system ATP-binding protein/oligopeptide transport system ATP-binding protein [Myceligenerans xiligouense]
MAEPALEVRDLVKHYPVRRGLLRRTAGTVKAVDGVSFGLGRGRTLGLVGESGSGKSTLARVLVGIETPTSGQVLVEGEDMARLSRAGRKQLRREVQMVFQDPYTSLNPRMSVQEIVGEPFAIHGVAPAGGRRAAVGELLELVGLEPAHANRYPHQFSGGQRQRVGIARALALRPRILVCDEPVSALDVSVQGQVINLLEDLQDELGLSYLFVAHDLGVVRHIAHDVAVMYLGRVVERGRETDVYDGALHPYTQALLSAVPEPDPAVRLTDSPAITLEGEPPSPIDPPPGCAFHTRCPLARTLGSKGDGETDRDGGAVSAGMPADGGAARAGTGAVPGRATAAGGAVSAGVPADVARNVPEPCTGSTPVLRPHDGNDAGQPGSRDDDARAGGEPAHLAACHFARTLRAPARVEP